MSSACAYCRDQLAEDDGVKVCQECGTPHHQDCFNENGGCTVFGCVNAPGDEPKIRVLIEDLTESVPSFAYPPVAATHAMVSNPVRQSGPYTRELPARESSRRKHRRFGILLERASPAPPDLPWGWLLTFSALTGGLFLLIWDLALARWMRDVQPKSHAIYYYGAVAVLHLVAVASLIGGQINEHNVWGFRLFVMAVILLSLIGRFSLRRSLEDYFEHIGAMGLCLSEGMTLFWGTIYFQYHLNHLMKRSEDRERAIV